MYSGSSAVLSPTVAALLLAICALVLVACAPREVSVEVSPARGASAARVLFLAGPDSHGPWAHEHGDGSALLAEELQRRWPGVETIQVTGGWPDDEALFDGINALVIYCDGGEGHLVNPHLQTFNRLLDQGVGVAALHYAVEVPRDTAAAAAMLRAIGGYFETDWSVNPHWEANFRSLPSHPVTRGIEPFTMDDEWYFNMRFQPDEQGVTPLLVAIPPAHTMERANGPHSGNDAVRKMVEAGRSQTLAWAYERDNGGRGFGFTGGHYHANWQNDNARNLVVNAIAWLAGVGPAVE